MLYNLSVAFQTRPGDRFVYAYHFGQAYGPSALPAGGTFRPGRGRGEDFAAGDGEATTPGCFVARVLPGGEPRAIPAKECVDVGQVVEGPFAAAGGQYYVISFVVPADWTDVPFIVYLRWRDEAGRLHLTPSTYHRVSPPVAPDSVFLADRKPTTAAAN